MTQSEASDWQNEGVAMLEMWESDLERLDQINNGKDVAKSKETQAVKTFREKHKSMIGNLQNQDQINNSTVEAKRDGIDESANVTDLERAKSTMRKSRQKVGGT